MTFKDQLTSQLKSALVKLGIHDVVPFVDYPVDSAHGDYSSNVALVAAKKLGKKPMEMAEEIAREFRIQNSEFRIEVARPGFINFWVSDEQLVEVIEHTQKISNIGKGRDVVIEYSSPNIAKPFTVGHLRSTIIGDAVANLLGATGWKVHRDNHVGDWGTQFGKQIYAIKTWGDEKEIEQAERPVKVLVDLYVKFHEAASNAVGKESKDDATSNVANIENEARAWFKKLEEGDAEARRLWEKCIEWSWKEFEAIYAKLGVSFTENSGRGYGESFFEDKMTEVIEELKEKDLLKQGEEGAQLVFFPNDKYPPLMILKKDGTTLYATRDLATDKFRLQKYGSDVVILNEVGSEQSLYFQQLYKIEELLGWVKKDLSQRVHIKHGLYRFKEGKMSTRKGNVIWLEDVLSEAERRAEELAVASDAADQDDSLYKVVGIGALKWNDLKRDSKQDIVFDWDDILNMQGNSGPYMQYTYARTQSVLHKFQMQNSKSQINTKYKIQNTKYQFQLEERELLVLLSRFTDIVEEAAGRYAPNILATYLFNLAQVFNLFYQKYPILKAEEEQKHFRLAVTEVTGETIKHGMSLLGISTPERM